MRRFDRRTLLGAAGLGGASLFLPSLAGRSAAQMEGPPRRLVIFYTLHGTVYDRWRMRRSGLTEDTDWEHALDDADPASFSEILRPLHGVRSDLLILDGISQASAISDVLFNEHEKGQAHSLTGAPLFPLTATRAAASAPSVDQIVARGIRRPDRLGSLELGIGGGNSVVYGASNARLPFESEPQAAFDRLFGGLPMGGDTPAARIQRAQPSVLDFVRSEYEVVRPRLGGEDRRKLELHRDLVRDLEERLGALAAASCTLPSRPGSIRLGSPGWYEARTDALTRITAAALACDLTRVVTLQMAQLPNEVCGAPPGDIHADFAHHDHEDARAKDVMTSYHRVHATQLRGLIDALKRVPEGNGTLLDSTAVVWLNELATGNHRFYRWPVVIAGNAGGAFRTGRYVRWAPRTPTPSPNPEWAGMEPLIGVPHNRLLVSLCRAMGLSTPSVGLSTLRTRRGVDLDLTTPLDRLS